MDDLAFTEKNKFFHLPLQITVYWHGSVSTEMFLRMKSITKLNTLKPIHIKGYI